jgi:hypothetical protein|eukprot:scaffold1657_cov182-Alexandrium_tamarense.AAC.31
MSFASRLADLAHKGFVSAAFGFFCWNAAQLGSLMIEGANNSNSPNGGPPAQEHPQAGFIQMLRDKYDEEYTKYFDTGHRDWYDKDDDSYLKKLPRPQDYQPGGKRN